MVSQFTKLQHTWFIRMKLNTPLSATSDFLRYTTVDKLADAIFSIKTDYFNKKAGNLRLKTLVSILQTAQAAVFDTHS